MDDAAVTRVEALADVVWMAVTEPGTGARVKGDQVFAVISVLRRMLERVKGLQPDAVPFELELLEHALILFTAVARETEAQT